ncbi:unnamed protein product [Tuber melanosporum]|uniref:(Perigord truffle) hypothetical protein n=1 Tax=Tuber melanosporum (strain Mel28) TaxID=656061 RepID=D5G864_TUBMM|nr:uncharacterized protein GSTUM_00002906001 [Tuber melanosporum]CAZ80707.1 unnamed protein product [Tuber melanosporum]
MSKEKYSTASSLFGSRILIMIKRLGIQTSRGLRQRAYSCRIILPSLILASPTMSLRLVVNTLV